MGITELLTIVFIVLKLCGVISWSWFFVLLPEIIAVGLYILLFVLNVALTVKIDKDIRRF